MKKSLFLKCIEFFNSKSIGTIITRKEFLQEVVSDAVWTRDNYRRFLTKAKFLEESGIGKYKRIFDIPINLTLTDLKTIAYNPTLTSLFTDLKYPRIGNKK